MPEMFLKMSQLKNRGRKRNKSDVTFGWNGFTNALTLYYLTPDEQFVTHDHAYPLGFFIFRSHKCW